MPGATVLTAWPATDELQKPELGYVAKPVPVVAIANFSAPEIAKAASLREDYSAALVFSTKYDPPRPLLSLGRRSAAIDERYFGLHHDLSPAAIARQLGGTLVWYREDPGQGQWIGLIRFNRQFEASLDWHAGQ
jgi:hypothetical protein